MLALTEDHGNAFPTKVQDFIDTLSEYPGRKPLDFLERELERFNPTSALLAPWINFDSKCYSRTSLYKDEYFEALVLAWRSGQRSPIHNHRGSACAVFVVEGVASEIMFEQSAHGALFPSGTTHYTAGRACGSYDTDIHQIVNLQPKEVDLVSLHVYSPPLKGMELFSLSQSTFADYDDILIRSAKRAAA